MTPEVFVHRNSQNLPHFPSGQYIAIPWTAEVYDPMKMLNPADPREIIIPLDGKYQIDCQAAGYFLGVPADVSFGAAIGPDGSRVLTIPGWARANFPDSCSGSLALRAGDRVTMVLAQSTGAELILMSAGMLYPCMRVSRTGDYPNDLVMA